MLLCRKRRLIPVLLCVAFCTAAALLKAYQGKYYLLAVNAARHPVEAVFHLRDVPNVCEVKPMFHGVFAHGPAEPAGPNVAPWRHLPMGKNITKPPQFDAATQNILMTMDGMSTATLEIVSR